VNRTELSLEVSKAHNLKVLRLFDTSKYCDEDVVENYLIEVLPVNKKSWVPYYVSKGFSLALNSSNLGYKKVNEDNFLIDIPDGIYEIKQSYKPNIHTVAHYYHLRTTALSLKYVELLCKHFSKECKKEERVYNAETLHLTRIKQYIDAAEYMVSEKHEKECGIKFYNKAVELIKEFEHECGC
jgi:hypothetical protein